MQALPSCGGLAERFRRGGGRRVGAMAAIEATEAEAIENLGALLDGKRMAIAAVNGPDAVVISGDEAVVEQAMASVREQGRRVSRLRVSHAFHSPLMEPMLADFAEIARSHRLPAADASRDQHGHRRPRRQG